MGNVKQVLGESQLPKRQHYYSKIWADVCENLHIHYRNLRLEFSEEEFDEFCRVVALMHQKSKEFRKDYKESPDNKTISMRTKTSMPAQSRYYTNRLRVEDEMDGSVHVHYRDLRIHMTKDEYNKFVDTLTKEKKSVVKIPINKINPYNNTHPEGWQNYDRYHREGIEMVKELINEGRKILPIAVTKELNKDGKHQRLDGFKRYFAFKELGYDEIDCVYDTTRGCQDKMAWDITDEE